MSLWFFVGAWPITENQLHDEVEAEIEDRISDEVERDIDAQIDDRIQEAVEARLVDRLREVDEDLASEVRARLAGEART